MASLKQQLATRPDWKQKDVDLTSLDGEPLTVTIQRLTILQRDELITRYKFGTAEQDNLNGTIAMIAMSVVPGDDPVTEEEVRAMPAKLVDELAVAIMAYNGWTKAGKAALDDQFRPAAGPAV